MDLKGWVRPNILRLEPYSSARDEFMGEAAAFLDANENPFNPPFNRYPDPLQRKLKSRLAQLKGVGEAQLFLGNGSDEPIDLLIRIFCEPTLHNIVLQEPTYGMYRVAAAINGVEVVTTALAPGYQLDTDALLQAVNARTRLLFLCSPNNPTGNAFPREAIEEILTGFPGPVVLDEAYADFCPGSSWLPRLQDFGNLIVLQTLSKAWGLAGIRVGMAFAHPDVTALLSKVKPPYNLSAIAQETALQALSQPERKEEWVENLLVEREQLAAALANLPFVVKVWPSDANFLLVKFERAREVKHFLSRCGIIVRDRSSIPLCENSLRITVGSPEENRLLMRKLQEYRNLSADRSGCGSQST